MSVYLTKPLVAWTCGTCATLLTKEASFGHAGSWAGGNSEHAIAKNNALREAGAHVPHSFHEFGEFVQAIFEELCVVRKPEPPTPVISMDAAEALRKGLIRRRRSIVSTISEDRGEELTYGKRLISEVISSNIGVGGVLALLWKDGQGGYLIERECCAVAAAMTSSNNRRLGSHKSLVKWVIGSLSELDDNATPTYLYATTLFAIGTFLQGGLATPPPSSTTTVGAALAHHWFNRELPPSCCEYLELILQLTADHAPPSAAHTAPFSAPARGRIWQPLSSLASP